jgi:hypothetical protein
MEEHNGQVTSPAATTNGWGSPSISAPGQNERVMLCLTKRTLPEEIQVILPFSLMREGVIHGRGR